jgi:glycosyltransferase involved in cell wall biosynthesis
MLSGGLRIKGIIKNSQENMHLITVVTVVRNGEKTLEETILSIINQTYTNIEYIIIDGASTDGTLDIIKKYEEKIDYWISEADKGIYDAMNKGIDLATGKFLIFMNTGDIFFSKYVINIFVSKVIDLNSIYYGDAMYVNNYLIEKTFRGGIFNKYRLALTNICHQTIFYPKIIYKKYKYNINFKYLADWVYNMMLFKRYKFVYINQIIAFYDNSGVSVSNRDLTFEKKYKWIILRYLGIIVIIYLLNKKLLKILRINKKIT